MERCRLLPSGMNIIRRWLVVLAAPTIIALSLFILWAFAGVLTKPYVYLNPCVRMAGHTVIQYTIVNPGPAAIKDAFFEVSLLGCQASNVLVSSSSGVNVAPLAQNGNQDEVRYRAYLDSPNNSRGLDVGESFSMTLVTPGDGGRQAISYAILHADGRKVEATDASSSRTGFIILLYQTVLALCIIYVLITNMRNAESVQPKTADETTVQEAQQTAESATRQFEDIEKEVKKSRPRRP